MTQERPISFYHYADLDVAARHALTVRSEEDLGKFLTGAQPIIDAVKADGDAALARFGQEFDKSAVTANNLKALPEEFDAAYEKLDRELLDAIEFAAENIRIFHERQLPEPMWLDEVRPGVLAGERTAPIPSVACYVPRGKGAFPSVLMMTAIPALVAGVPRVIVLTPPTPEGNIDTATLAACKVIGITDVYKCGGAQAVAAAAYGTETVPKVAKIVGPSNPWGVAAKRLLSGVIDPGIPAGPSESVILADETANPHIAALDLIIESEHGPDSSAWLVTNSRFVAEEARKAIPGYWEKMGAQRVDFSSKVLGGKRGGIILTDTWEQAVEFTNLYAPEHLEILSDDALHHVAAITNAGEILLGENSPIVLGNFVIGVNAILPTSGMAQTHSPLSIFDFTKRISVARVSKTAYPEMAKHAEVLAKYEGFEAHANAVSSLREAAHQSGRQLKNK